MVLSFDFMRKSFEYSSSVIGNSSRISLIASCRFCSIVREIAGCVGFILSSLSRVETSRVSIVMSIKYYRSYRIR